MPEPLRVRFEVRLQESDRQRYLQGEGLSLHFSLGHLMILRNPGEGCLAPFNKEPTGAMKQTLFPNSWSSISFFRRNERRQRFLLLQRLADEPI